jgi:hypothetical protein
LHEGIEEHQEKPQYGRYLSLESNQTPPENNTEILAFGQTYSPKLLHAFQSNVMLATPQYKQSECDIGSFRSDIILYMKLELTSIVIDYLKRLDVRMTGIYKFY